MTYQQSHFWDSVHAHDDVVWPHPPTGMVTEAEWQGFLRDEVTPRFPEGLTVLDADGQWRRTDGSIGRERSKVLVILHDEKPATLTALGALVVRYKEVFTQESVLWESARVCAAF